MELNEFVKIKWSSYRPYSNLMIYIEIILTIFEQLKSKDRYDLR